MFRSPAMLAVACRLGLIAFGLVIGAVSSSTVQAQAPAAKRLLLKRPSQLPQPRRPRPRRPRRPSACSRRTPGWCSTSSSRTRPPTSRRSWCKLKEALQKSEKPERKQQAASWKVFKSPEPAGANVLYVFVIDPAVKDADYTVSNILAEVFPPAELNTIYKQYADSYAQGQNIINLNLITAFGK